MKENSFTLKMPRSRQYPVESITDADDLAHLFIYTCWSWIFVAYPGAGS